MAIHQMLVETRMARVSVSGRMSGAAAYCVKMAVPAAQQSDDQTIKQSNYQSMAPSRHQPADPRDRVAELPRVGGGLEGPRGAHSWRRGCRPRAQP